MNKAAILAQDDTFIDYMAELCVGSNMFDNSFGNPFAEGTRFAGKWIFDCIMLNKEIPENRKSRCLQKCATLYVKRKEEEKNNASNDGPSGLFQ